MAFEAMSKMSKPTQQGAQKEALALYALFGICIFMVHTMYANGQYSSVLTMSVMFQCLAFALLFTLTWTRGNASGISAQSLTLEAISFGCRLSSTIWLNGYLPVDETGDWIFQASDVLALLIVLALLYLVLKVQKHTYQEEHDSMSIVPMAVVSLVLASLLHGDMNSRPIFDTLWMTGLFCGVLAVLPQLWLINRTGGVIEAGTSHYMAMLAVSRLISGTFMWHARYDVTCKPWIVGVNHAIWAILSAHALHLLLLGDFWYYYLKAVAQKGLSCKIELPSAGDFV